jgi:hypothetical protein
MNRKSLLAKGVLATVVAAGALSAAAPAFAEIACNRWGECWRVSERYTYYPPNLGVTFHDDDWWRDHHHRYHMRRDRDDDHGYYMHGRWRAFDRDRDRDRDRDHDRY